MKPAYLILETGEVFAGRAFGAVKEAVGELVFTTAMTGYLETLTDPSYEGQIVLQTFPLIGNYGIIGEDFESDKPYLRAYIVKYPCQSPSNFRSTQTLDAYLKENGVAGLCGIDTRRLVKLIRSFGTMNGKIMYTPPGECDRAACAAASASAPVTRVSPSVSVVSGTGKRRIALLDFGAKKGIEAALLARDCTVKRFPYDAAPGEILAFCPHGVVLSNGPGDPADPANGVIVETIKSLQGAGLPLFGICLGHQLIALANGYKTEKLKFGHRGANQPVRDTATGRVYITSQNHGYAVVADGGAFVNVNDGTCEGLDYGLSFSVQFHPEACGGPRDTSFLFDRFIERAESRVYAEK